MPFVGLTGGMGAGKSTALEALARLGAAVLSTDAVVHDLYSSDPSLRDAITRRWGDDLAPGGVTDRALVAERAFADDEERRWLEALVWPLVAARVAAWLQEVNSRQPPPRAAVVEVPLLFEAGMESAYDATIAVIAPEALRRERADARGHALAEERASRQLAQEEKARRADFTVRNDGSIGQLEADLASVLARLSRSGEDP